MVDLGGRRAEGFPNHFPIASIQVTIRDPQKRWKELVLDFDPGKNSYIVKWDRRFGDGTLAPVGNTQFWQ